MNFKVGDKVKKVVGHGVGMTGTVSAIGHFTHDYNGVWLSRPCDLIVKSDKPWDTNTGARWTAADPVYTHAEMWRPIVPPKAQELVSWDECEFTRDGKYRQPEYAGVGA